MERQYFVTVKETSKEVSKRDIIKLKDTTNAIPLDRETQVDAVIITPVLWAILDIHNERGEDKDYRTFVVQDSTGQLYKTGSVSFWTAFMDIWDELGNDEEPFDIKVYRLPSKNRQGKDFITCSLV